MSDVALVRGFSGIVHRAGCYAIPKGTMPTISGRKVLKYRVVAPEIDEDEAPAFIRARKIDPCGSCWPGLRAAIAEEAAAK